MMLDGMTGALGAALKAMRILIDTRSSLNLVKPRLVDNSAAQGQVSVTVANGQKVTVAKHVLALQVQRYGAELEFHTMQLPVEFDVVG